MRAPDGAGQATVPPRAAAANPGGDGAIVSRAVLLDAHGTLVALDDPVERLTEGLRRAGHPNPVPAVAAALRAEIGHYRANHDRGRDADSLAALRRECAAVLACGLVSAPALDVLTDLLIDALRFRAYPDVVPALDALARAGWLLAVVSNWDCSLAGTLAELDLADRFGAVITSAEVGAAKPDPRPFRAALAAVGAAEGSFHCGDDPAIDCDGALAAGLRCFLVDRADRHPATTHPRVRDLGELVAALA